MRIKHLQLKRAVTAVLFTLLLSAVGMTNLMAQSFTLDNLNYSINADGNTVTLTGHVDGQNATGTLVIPNTVSYGDNSYTVTTIGNSAFSGCSSLTGSLTIPDSVTRICVSAFQYCSGFTGTLTLGNSVTTIEDSAFGGCNGFTGSLIIPNSVTIIGGGSFFPNGAFYGCSGFTGDLNIPNSVTFLGEKSFQNCTGFNGTLTISNSLTELGMYAFRNCSGFTGELVIPNSMITIGGWTFTGCSGFTGLTIPTSVTSIGQAFNANCTGLTGVHYLGDLSQWCNIDFEGYQSNPLFYAHNLYINDTLVTNLVIPEGVTEIKNSAFERCSASGSLTIPNSVNTIGEYAFYQCSGLTGNLNIPDSVTFIGSRAFSDCSGFTGELVIPSSLTSIEEDVFGGCSGFSGLSLPNTIVSIGKSAFSGLTGCSGDLTIPNSVTSIGDYAFEGCSGNILTIPSSVLNIGQGSFCQCNLVEIHYYAPNCAGNSSSWTYNSFSACTGTLLIGDNVVVIPNRMFAYAGFTGFLRIPSSVTTIGERAFYGCNGFTGFLRIPNSVASIGAQAFFHCSGFTGMFLSNALTSIATGTFRGCTGLTSVTIPDSVTTIEHHAFYDCRGLTSLTIPNSVTLIDYDAFYRCTGLTSLTIGSSVASINSLAFYNCNHLNSIQIFAETPPTVTNNAFSSVNHDIPVVVPCGTLSDYQNASVWNAFTNMRDACDLLTYSINDDGVSVTVTGHVDGSAAVGPIIIPETKTIDGVTYTVTAIGNYAFRNCTGLTSDLIIPNTVVTIGTMAFMNCIGFTGSLVIPNSVTTIGGGAFRNCSGFTGSLTLGSALTSIGSAFSGCDGFTSIISLAVFPPGLSSSVFSYDIPVTVPCGSMSMYQIVSSWSNFTNMEEDCSGMYEVSAMANPTEGGHVRFGAEGETLFTDTFEEYTLGNGVASEAIAAGHDWWTTWSGELGGGEDGIVTEYNGTRCGHLTYGNDQILLLDKESGVYDVEFDILVPEGKTAFFSFLHQLYGTVNEAMYCHLHLINENYQYTLAPGQGRITVGGYGIADIACVYDAWMHFRFHVDIDANIARFYYTAPEAEESFVCQWPWSWNSNSTGYTGGGLAAMDFWPPLEEEYAEFYIDNFSLKQFTGELSEEHYNYDHDTYFAPGSTCILTAIPNEGYSFVNWTKDGAVVSTEQTYSFTVTENAALVANFIGNGAQITQTINLSQGWNNISIYLAIEDPVAMLDQLKEGLGENALTIEGSEGYTEFDGEEWFGDLDELGITNEQSYMINVLNSCTVELQGMPANPTDYKISISQGWNRIGFPSAEELEVAVALSEFAAEEGDMLEGPDGYTEFDGEEWFGDIEMMEPGMGYQYFSNSDEPKTLVFHFGRKGNLKRK